MAAKDFSVSRAANRVKQLTEEEAMFGVAPMSTQETPKPVIEDTDSASATKIDIPEPTVQKKVKPKSKQTKQMTLIIDEDLYYDMKAYLASRECPWNSAAAMIRDLIAERIKES